MLAAPEELIDDEIKAFGSDSATALAERTLTELMVHYPDNRSLEHIYVKVITINALYHARVLDKDLQAVAEHIFTLNLDDKLKDGDPVAVDLIYNCPKTKRYFSFATKYCSWHNQNAYAIYDGNVYEVLCGYRRQDKNFKFKDQVDLFDNKAFVALIRRFMSIYELEQYSLKQVDKFLWMLGWRLLAAKEAKKLAQHTVK